MREKEIEKMLVNAVKIHGGLALKFVSPNFNGMPDRLILKNIIFTKITPKTRTENEEHTDKAKKAIGIIRLFGVLH